MRLKRFEYRNFRQCLGAFACLSLIAFAATANAATTVFKTDWPFLHTAQGTHEVRVLNDGLTSFEYRVQMLERSKSSIDCMIYLFGTDDSGSLLLHTMMKRALEGAHVRLLLDWYNETGKPEIDDDVAAAITRELKKQAGPSGLKGRFEIRYYNRGTVLGKGLKLNHRNHAKLLIVDKSEMIVGGRNIGDDYSSLQQGGHDYIDRELWVKSVSMTPAQNSVLQARAAFDAYWNDAEWVSKPKVRKETDVLTDDALNIAALGDRAGLPEQTLRDLIATATKNSKLKTYVVPRVIFAIDKPNHRKIDRVVTPVINQMLNHAEQYLMIENYSLPMSDAKRALMESVAKRKVPMLLLTNGFESHDSKGVSAFSQPQEAALLKSAPNVWLWAYRGQMLPSDIRLKNRKVADVFATHTKTLVSFSNSQWLAGVGSYNFDVRSEKTNNEAMIVIDDPAVVREITDDIFLRTESSHPVVVGHNDRLYYSDTAEYQKRFVSGRKKIVRALGLWKVLRSMY